jgi:hypothetical protein
VPPHGQGIFLSLASRRHKIDRCRARDEESWSFDWVQNQILMPYFFTVKFTVWALFYAKNRKTVKNSAKISFHKRLNSKSLQGFAKS